MGNKRVWSAWARASDNIGVEASEHEIQCAYFQWVAQRAYQDERFKNIFAIPNGGARHIVTAVKMKAEGVRPGVPDIFIAAPNQLGANGAFIEVKKAGKKATATQLEWHDRLRKHGYVVVVLDSLDKLIRFTQNYMTISKVRGDDSAISGRR